MSSKIIFSSSSDSDFETVQSVETVIWFSRKECFAESSQWFRTCSLMERIISYVILQRRTENCKSFVEDFHPKCSPPFDSKWLAWFFHLLHVELLSVIVLELLNHVQRNTYQKGRLLPGQIHQLEHRIFSFGREFTHENFNTFPSPSSTFDDQFRHTLAFSHKISVKFIR